MPSDYVVKTNPCPFCSMKGSGCRPVERGGVHSLECGGCGARGPVSLNPEESLMSWNSRGKLQSLTTEELKKYVSNLAKEGAD